MKNPQKDAVWFRHDLRIADNPALHAACQRGNGVIALFVATPGQWRSHHVSRRRLSLTFSALDSLRLNLAELGIELKVLTCEDFDAVPSLIERFIDEEGIACFFSNREYAWNERLRDASVADLCRQRGVDWIALDGNTLLTPGTVKTGSDQPYRVFTPFKRRAMSILTTTQNVPPLPPPAAAGPAVAPPQAYATDPTFAEDVSGWPGDEEAANKRLDHFLDTAVENYHKDRDLPSIDGTSRLSPCLTIGTLSARQCLHRCLLARGGDLSDNADGPNTWINELLWREFYLHQLEAFPRISYNLPLRPETARVPWRHDRTQFEQWCEGASGYPLVDAAMHQLNQTGWMHNRLRMLTAMFLAKALLIDWRWGERYFMEQLVDGHFASNNGGWQWSASTGADAAPYFRLLSPVRQAQRFDPEATFIKHYLPALQTLPAKIIHQPGHPALIATGYPAPMVDWATARDRCLSAFKKT